MEVEIKNQTIGDLKWKIDTMEEEEKVYQVQVAELGQRVLQLEDEVNKGKDERETLEKLLSNSRAVASAMTNNSKEKQETRKEAYSDMDTPNHGFNDQTEPNNQSTYSNNDTSESEKDIAYKSLQNELEATKQREQQLREQLNGVSNKGENELGLNSIMETLTESQQEAILYLTSEIENLRVQMKQEQQKLRKLHEEYKVNLDLTASLQQEIKLLASEILEKEKYVESVQEDLSLKLGQNACLRDEVVELEEKMQQQENLVQELKEMLTGKEEECSHYLSKMRMMENVSDELAQTKQKLRSITKSGTDESLCIIDINGNKCLEEQEEDLSQEELVSIEPEVATSRLIVLKKALKKDYEKKLKNFKLQMQKKDEEIERLTRENDTTSSALREELNIEHFNRVSQEALVHEDIEHLRNSVKERDHELFLAKQKIRTISKETEKGVHWGGLSETLIDGVGATIEMFESISWSKESKQKNKSKEEKPSRYHLSSKSFG
jgi:hypothetical protein